MVCKNLNEPWLHLMHNQTDLGLHLFGLDYNSESFLDWNLLMFESDLIQVLTQIFFVHYFGVLKVLSLNWILFAIWKVFGLLSN